MKPSSAALSAGVMVAVLLAALPVFALYISVADLGVLNADVSGASGTNDAGQVTGGLFFQAASRQRGFFWQAGTMTDIGTLGGSSSSPNFKKSINKFGQVVGVSDTAGGEQHAFIWQKEAGMSDLGTLGGNSSSAYAINDAGQVVGESTDVTGLSHAFLWQNGSITDLGALAQGCKSVAFAINASGVIVGSSQTSPGGLYHAVIWQGGVITDLGVLPGNNYSTGVDINNAAQVVALSYTSSPNQTTDFRAFLWQNGVAVDLGSLGGGRTSPEAINNFGQVIGTSSTSNGDPHAFLWQLGTLVDLGTLGGKFSTPFSINGSGEVVGWASDSSGTTQSFVWQNGTMTSLPTLGGGSAHSRLYINNQGQIAGASITQAGIGHAALWTVLAAPPTLTITASAGAGGSISPSGAIQVVINANQTFNITPNPYYHVADVVVDGVFMGPMTSYTFNNVTASHTIAATFVLVNIGITNPTSQSVWAKGADHTVTWTYLNDPGKIVKIELLAQGSVVDVINNGVSIGKNGSGSYRWHTPAKLLPGTYQIRLTSTTNSQFSDTSAEFAVPF